MGGDFAIPTTLLRVKEILWGESRGLATPPNPPPWLVHSKKQLEGPNHHRTCEHAYVHLYWVNRSQISKLDKGWHFNRMCRTLSSQTAGLFRLAVIGQLLCNTAEWSVLNTQRNALQLEDLFGITRSWGTTPKSKPRGPLAFGPLLRLEDPTVYLCSLDLLSCHIMSQKCKRRETSLAR